MSDDEVVQIEVDKSVRDAFKKYLLLYHQCQRGKMRREVNQALVEYLQENVGEEEAESLLESDYGPSPGVDTKSVNGE